MLLLGGIASIVGTAVRPSSASAFAVGGRRVPGTLSARARGCASRSRLRRAAEESARVGRISVQDLQPGQELNGLVTSVAPFGCFVDVGADRDGFVHISQISENFVDEVANFVQPGQSVKVFVRGTDEEGKLDLSMVKAKAEPGGATVDLTPFVDISPEEWLEGNVAAITDFGLFVLVLPPGGGTAVQGLVHISQIREGFVEHPAEEAEVGQVVKVRVAAVEPDNGKLKLSMKPYAGPKAYTSPGSQDIGAFSDVSPSLWIKGRVHHTAPFGAFVELEPPAGGDKVMGLVHVTEMREGFVDDPTQEVDVDQEIEVRVVKADPRTGRLSLSMKKQPEGLA